MVMNFRTSDRPRKPGLFRNGENEEAILSQLREIRAPRQLTADETRSILSLLSPNSPPRVVAAAAFALAEAKATDAIQPLTAMLRQSTDGFPETVLYAVNELGGELPVEVLVGLVGKGPSEALEEALMFLDEDRLDLSGADIEAVCDSLERLAEGADPATAEVIEEILDRLPDPASRPGP